MQSETSKEALQQAEALGVLPEALNAMLTLSSPRGKGVRGYHAYLFTMLDGVCVGVQKEAGQPAVRRESFMQKKKTQFEEREQKRKDTPKAKPKPVATNKVDKPVKSRIIGSSSCATCGGAGRVKVLDTCPECHGKGCADCDQGEAIVWVPCQECAAAKFKRK